MKDDDLRNLTDELAVFLQECADFQTVSEMQSVLLAARDIVLNLRRRLQQARRRYVVAVVGLGNVGKSTLLNALFQHDLAPRRNGPCTAVPIEFTLGQEPELIIDYQEHFGRKHIRCKNTNEIREVLDELANDSGNQASQTIRRIIVQLNHPLLQHGLTIADTPGFGAAQVADAAGSHEGALRNYLKKEVAQVFWVALGEQGIGKREQRFHEELLADICDDVVVTGCEEWDERDCKRFKSRFASLFGHRLPAFHFVSSIERTGIAELETRIRVLADPTGRFKSVRDGLWELARDLRIWIREFEASEQLSSHFFWRPDSWERLELAPDCDGLLHEITAALE